MPDERSLSGRIEITRNLKMMRKKILNAKPTLCFDNPIEPRSWRNRTIRNSASKPNEGKAPRSRPQSARSANNRNRKVDLTFSSSPQTLGLARVLSANRRKAQHVDYSKVVHTKNLSKMYTKIDNMESDLKKFKAPLERDTRSPSRKKGFNNTRVSIDWETGFVSSAPTSPFAIKERPKKSRRPQSAPAKRRGGGSKPKSLKSTEQTRAYKEAIKDYIVENSIYEEERLHQLFENYKKEKRNQNEDVVVKAIEELKLELNIV